jgi:hypothetical protein
MGERAVLGDVADCSARNGLNIKVGAHNALTIRPYVGKSGEGRGRNMNQYRNNQTTAVVDRSVIPFVA